MCTTVEHSRPAILNGADEPTPAIALDCSLAPKEGRSGDGLNRMRRDLRLSTERQDFSHVDLDEANSKADGPSASNGEATTTKTFRSRRLSTEAMGSATGKAKAKGATKGASTLSPRALLAKLDIGKHDAKEAHNPRLLIASEYEELSRSGGGKAAAVNGAAGSAGAWHLAPGIDSTTVGVLSCHGAEPSNSVTGQSAKINQDCACVLAKVGGVECAAIFCVYDGHGACGREVSTYAMRRMNAMLDEKHAELLKRRPHWALASAFNDVQDELRSPPPSVDVDAEHSGACALVAYMRERTLWVAGAGDTRAVLGTRSAGMLAAIALSTDHSKTDPLTATRATTAPPSLPPSPSPWLHLPPHPYLTLPFAPLTACRGRPAERVEPYPRRRRPREARKPARACAHLPGRSTA